MGKEEEDEGRLKRHESRMGASWHGPKEWGRLAMDEGAGLRVTVWHVGDIAFVKICVIRAQLLFFEHRV